jgi:uncharacterized protein (DUF433 family)
MGSIDATDDWRDAIVVTSPEIMGGVAVFAGTRVPIDMVIGSIEAGIDPLRLLASYPFLTEAHLQAARAYEHAHPRSTAPRRLAGATPAKVRRVIRNA